MYTIFSILCMEVLILKKLNNYTYFGLLFYGIWLMSLSLKFLPSLIEGLLAGLGCIFVLIGLNPENNDILKLKNYRMYLLNKVLKK